MKEFSLNVLENSLHSLYFALKHIENSNNLDKENMEYSEGIVSKKENGKISFYLNNYHLPSKIYEKKFAIQLINQSFELLMISIISDKYNNDIIWEDKNKEKTISVYKSIKLFNDLNLGIKIKDNEFRIIKKIRNDIEHYKFCLSIDEIDTFLKELLFLILVIYKIVYGDNLIEMYCFNSWEEKEDTVFYTFQEILHNFGNEKKGYELFFLKKDEIYTKCLNCGFYSLEMKTKKCNICQYEVDNDIELDFYNKIKFNKLTDKDNKIVEGE
ncbi:MAG: hypothetical protein KA885_10640 [Spirochaetes bacterium]|nr:hypothetical protein [Spirochaetota bacterium]